MFGSKKRKAKQALDEIWRSMEMSCANNYKDLAQESLKEYEVALEQYHEDGSLPDGDYQKRKKNLEEKQQTLKNYNHKQHIGW